MSKAYKCDRCGKVYEPYKKNSDSLHITRNPNFSNLCLDLCPKCNAELQEWVANDTVQVNCTDEEKQKADDTEIRVGDEVELMDSTVGVVTHVYESMSDLKNSKKLDVIMANGKCSMTESAYIEKTGRHFAIIQDIFKQMKGE